jgi:hypothetical protein
VEAEVMLFDVVVIVRIHSTDGLTGPCNESEYVMRDCCERKPARETGFRWLDQSSLVKHTTCVKAVWFDQAIDGPAASRSTLATPIFSVNNSWQTDPRAFHPPVQSDTRRNTTPPQVQHQPGAVGTGHSLGLL